MAEITIPFLNKVQLGTPVHMVSELLSRQQKHYINRAPWPDYAYQPDVAFAIAYGADCIAIQYEVKEQEIKAIYTQPNDPVYKDSCVEFFVSFDEKGYYNFEFNCLGTCLAAFGANRSERNFLPIDRIQKIKALSHLYRNGEEDKMMQWQLTLLLPFGIFIHHSGIDLKNKTARANFYKCGDELTQPHYLCWNNILSPQPNFHLPQFFGEIYFG